jgi:hypothetical protein
MTAKKGQIQVEHECNYSLKDYIGFVHLASPSTFTILKIDATGLSNVLFATSFLSSCECKINIGKTI